MASFLVLRPDRAEALDDTVFIRDGLSWLGLILPPLYLAIHRLWLALALVLGGLVALSAIGSLAGIGWLGLLGWVLAGFYVGLEGPELRVGKLASESWQLIDVIVADRLDDAEAIHFSNQAADITGMSKAAAPAWLKPAAPVAISRLSGPALGLVDPYGSR